MADTDTPIGKPRNASRDASMYQLLSEQLADCKSSAELLKLAQTTEFHSAARSLDDTDLLALRAQYKSRRESLDGKTKLEPFDGQVLTVFHVSNWFSEQWQNDGVTMSFTSESEPISTAETMALGKWSVDKEYTALTSAPAIVRFCNSFRELPSRDNPIRGRFYLVPVSDPARARQGQRMWKVDRLVERQQMDIPF